MRLARFIVCAGLSLAGCELPSGQTGSAGPQSVIVVRDFRVTAQTRVVVDTSFGFSLSRGEPGVPLHQRAAGLTRAAAFGIADALTDRLRQLGHTAIHAEAETPDPIGKSLIVVGTLRDVNEGHRRRVGNDHATIAADVEIDEWAPGIRPIAALHLDSALLADDGIAGPTGADTAALGIAAARLGREIAHSVVEIAGRSGISPTGR